MVVAPDGVLALYPVLWYELKDKVRILDKILVRDNEVEKNYLLFFSFYIKIEKINDCCTQYQRNRQEFRLALQPCFQQIIHFAIANKFKAPNGSLTPLFYSLG